MLSSAPPRLVLKVKKGEKACSLFAEAAEAAPPHSFSQTVLSAMQAAEEKNREIFFAFSLVFLISYGKESFPKSVSFFLELFKPVLD